MGWHMKQSQRLHAHLLILQMFAPTRLLGQRRAIARQSTPMPNCNRSCSACWHAASKWERRGAHAPRPIHN